MNSDMLTYDLVTPNRSTIQAEHLSTRVVISGLVFIIFLENNGTS